MITDPLTFVIGVVVGLVIAAVILTGVCYAAARSIT